MNTLQKLPWPDKKMPTTIHGMYFRGGLHVFDPIEKKLKIKTGETLSFDTYFGAFSLSTWGNEASINDVTVRVKGVGGAMIRIIWTGPDGTSTTLDEQEISCDRNTPSTDPFMSEVSLKSLKGMIGILYPEIIALEGGFMLSDLEYVTSTPPVHDVRLAIIMTTFKREEYVHRNIEKINGLIRELPEGLELFVIDNGQSLGNCSPSEMVHILPNRNFGGTGGFTRGLLEGLDSPASFTHFLFCDDDIEIEIESIRRTFRLWGYLKEDSVVGGAMLRMIDMVPTEEIWEIGSWVDPSTGFHVKTENSSHHLNSMDRMDLIRYDNLKKINYFAWWFFSFSRSLIDQVGLPLPLFVRADDIEFGMRVANKGFNFVTLLGVGVWHEDFIKKRLGLVMGFYGTRNHRIISLIYGKRMIENYAIFYSSFTNIFRNLLSLRYKLALAKIMALSEVLNGPERLMNVFQSAWDFHGLLGKELTLEIVESKRLTPLPKKNYKLGKFLSLITLNAHLLPRKFLIDEKNSIILPYDGERLFDSFRWQKIIYHDSFTGKGYLCQHSKKVFFSLLLKSIFLFIKSLIFIPLLRSRYRKAFPFMTSKTYWRKVFSSSNFK